MSFRDATRNDLPEIVAIYNSTIPSRLVTADTEPVSVESRVKWFEEHSPTKRPLWMIEDEHHGTIGWVSFQSFYGRPAYKATVEISIYLRASVRGRGIGKEVLKYAMEKSASLGINTLLGFIFAHNIPSLKLFRRMGFEQWALLPNIAVLDGVERSLIIVGKRLQP